MMLSEDLKRITLNAILVSGKIPVEGESVREIAKRTAQQNAQLMASLEELTKALKENSVIVQELSKIQDICSWLENAILNVQVIASQNKKKYAPMIIEIAAAMAIVQRRLEEGVNDVRQRINQ